MSRYVVRGFGYQKTHAIEIDPEAITDSWWPSKEYPFRAIHVGAKALCGIAPRSVQKVLIVMKPGTVVDCRLCAAYLLQREFEGATTQESEE